MAARTKQQAPTAQPRRTLGIKVPEEKPTTTQQTEESDIDIRDAFMKIDKMFRSIGDVAETRLPVSPHRNNAQDVAEYVLAEHLQKLAKERFDAAKERAEKAGIFGDEGDYIPGQTVQVWQSPHYSILVKKNKDSTMIDKDQVLEVLMNRLGHDKAQEAYKECLKPRAGARSIIVSVK